MVRLMRALPFSVSMAFLTMPSSASLRMPTLCRLAGRHAQGHLVLLEGDDEQLERDAGDLLLLDADDAADAMRRIDDPLVSLEPMPLADRLLGPGGCRRRCRRGSCRSGRPGSRGRDLLPGLAGGGRHRATLSRLRLTAGSGCHGLLDGDGLGEHGRLGGSRRLLRRRDDGRSLRLRLGRARLGRRDRASWRLPVSCSGRLLLQPAWTDACPGPWPAAPSTPQT